MKRKTTEQFIKESKEIHGDKYDYSLVEYINWKTKVKIICPEHGVFEQNPNSHLQGADCKKCGLNKMSKTKRKTTEQFIKEAKEIHGNKYNYSLVEYKLNNENVVIICPKHGIFTQTPITHLSGYGCNKCSKNYNYTTEEYIKMAKDVHGDKYDYSITQYINKRTKIDIICHNHGKFSILPNNHIYGKKTGCAKCQESNGEMQVRKVLENNNIVYISQKRFDDCKHKRTLPFDFYLPDFNMCIEFDGIQHFEPIKYWRGEKEFLEIKKKDRIKNEYCKYNNIRLIRIKYDENIEEKLNLYLMN